MGDNMTEYTRIRLCKETVRRLKELGKKGETYDDIINRLIRHYNLGPKYQKMTSQRL